MRRIPETIFPEVVTLMVGSDALRQPVPRAAISFGYPLPPLLADVTALTGAMGGKASPSTSEKYRVI